MLSKLANDTDAALDRSPEARNENADITGPFDWRSVHQALCRISSARAGLDAEEARWLRDAEALEIWRPLGMVSALDYLERVMGYSPKAGRDRLRVARALGSLPVLSAALAEGAVTYSAVRELSRVVTPVTEAEWLGHTRGMNLRQIEDLVSGHRPGDRPSDPPDPDVRTRVVRFELSPESFALLRQAHGALNEEHGRHLGDDELVTSLCSAVLDGGAATDEASGRARFQIAITVCERCRQGWQDGAGVRVALSADAVERAMCDAQNIGSIDGAAPERATQDVTPSVMRLVKTRDGGRCRVPGCRSSRGLEAHHIVHRADGGSHDLNNLATLCSACHMAHHRGLLAISGTADRLDVRRPGITAADADARLCAEGVAVTDLQKPASEAGEIHVGPPARSNVHPSEVTSPEPGRLCVREVEDAPHVGRLDPPPAPESSSKLVAEQQRVLCKQALIDMGWKPGIANAASRAAIDALGGVAPLDRLILDALRRCPRPTVPT